MSYQTFKELASLLSLYEAYHAALRKGVPLALVQLWKNRCVKELTII